MPWAEVAFELRASPVFSGEGQISGFVANINGEFLVLNNIISLLLCFPSDY